MIVGDLLAGEPFAQLLSKWFPYGDDSDDNTD